MPGDVYELRGFAVPEELERLHELLTGAAGDHPGLDPTMTMLFETAVIEIANNVVEHGRPTGKVVWEFQLVVHLDRLEATLSDSAQPFDGVVSSAMPGELAETGRGLAMASSLLDELTYQRADDRNHWHMVRRRGPGEGGHG